MYLRLFFILIAIISGSSVYSQILDPELQWFTIDDYFIESDIKKNNIHTITISKATKKDKSTIKNQPKQLKYIFDSEGLLFQSSQIDGRYSDRYLKRKTFQYNQYHQVESLTEDFGYFSFEYRYLYKEGYLSDIIKIEGKSGDTLFHKRFTNEINDSIRKISTINDIGKAYKTRLEVSKLNCKGSKTTYSRNPRFEESKLYFQNGRLNTSYKKVGEMNKTTEYSSDFIYQDDYLSDIISFVDGEKFKRFGMIYGPDGLIKNVIVRDFIKKDVEIYTFSYEYYSSN